MNEIYVGNDIEKALLKLKKKYAQEIGRSIASHLFFESRTQRKRRKRKRSVMRLKKLEARSYTRVATAIRRESRDKRAAGMGYVRA
jgi:ribosomal protein S21